MKNIHMHFVLIGFCAVTLLLLNIVAYVAGERQGQLLPVEEMNGRPYSEIFSN